MDGVNVTYNDTVRIHFIFKKFKMYLDKIQYEVYTTKCKQEVAMNRRTKIIEWTTVYTLVSCVFMIGSVALTIGIVAIKFILNVLGVV